MNPWDVLFLLAHLASIFVRHYKSGSASEFGCGWGGYCGGGSGVMLCVVCVLFNASSAFFRVQEGVESGSDFDHHHHDDHYYYDHHHEY